MLSSLADNDGEPHLSKGYTAQQYYDVRNKVRRVIGRWRRPLLTAAMGVLRVTLLFCLADQALPTDVTGTHGWQTHAKGNLTNFQASYPENSTALDISVGISELLSGDYNDSCCHKHPDFARQH
jgi:hypothetical protein